MMKYSLLLVVLLFAACTTPPKEELFTKSTTFPTEFSIDQKIDIASRVIPTEQQLEWQKMELTAFLHFGMNTFTNKAWGDGKDSPDNFNPTNLDTEQWVKTLKNCGFKMVIITAKHHDGFCLWPTQTTEYSVKSSPWKNGQGDVIRELKESCDKHGMKFGVYLSPWDRNATSYGSDQYNDFFIAQLQELLTQYGEVYEVWFDGANGEGPNGKVQQYDWTRILAKIRELQPKAVTAIMGDDVRWVGNESGLGRDTEWSVTPLVPSSYAKASGVNKGLDINGMSKDLGSRELLAKSSELYWYPSEVDVSIRPEWFYHSEEDDKVKSLKDLVNIYFNSVGCNSVLLLNIPPDLEGRIHSTDEKRLYEFRDYLVKAFANNLVEKGDLAWNTAKETSREYAVSTATSFNTVMLQEDISKGQRVEEFVVEVYENGAWTEIASGTTIGYKRLLRTRDYQSDKIRVNIKKSRNHANISNVGLFNIPSLEDNARKEVLNDVNTDAWTVVSPSGMDAKLYDGDKSTDCKVNELVPIVVDMKNKYDIKGFTYSPTTKDDKSGTIFKYKFYVSLDGVDWLQCTTSGEFSNIRNNPITQFVSLDKIYNARYIKLEPLQEIDGKKIISIAELGVLLNK